MSDTLAIKALLASGIMAMLLAFADPLAAQGQETVHGLRQAGWVVVEKSEHDEWYEGIAPYEKLRRQVYVVTYTLQKDGKTVTCTLARDVMYDTFKQTCSPAE